MKKPDLLRIVSQHAGIGGRSNGLQRPDGDLRWLRNVREGAAGFCSLLDEAIVDERLENLTEPEDDEK